MVIDDSSVRLRSDAFERDHGLGINEQDIANEFLRQVLQLREAEFAAKFMQISTAVMVELAGQERISLWVKQMRAQEGSQSIQIGTFVREDNLHCRHLSWLPKWESELY